MMLIHRIRRCFRRLAMLCGVTCLLVSTGCTTLRLPPLPFAERASGDLEMLEGAQPLQGSQAEQIYQGVRQARAQNSVVLHVPSDNTSIRVLPLPSDGRTVYVSNLLKQTGVQKKLGTFQATLYRHSTASIKGIPMECKMSRDGQSIRPESDYALQPGDRLRVQKAASPALKGFISMALGL